MGHGYWILIADGFGDGLCLINPRVYTEGMELETYVGHPILRINKQPVFLKDLAPGRGRQHEEPNIECGVACERVEDGLYPSGKQ